MTKEKKSLINYLIIGILVFLYSLPGAIVGGLISIPGGLFYVIGLLIGFVVTGYVFVNYWKKGF